MSEIDPTETPADETPVVPEVPVVETPVVETPVVPVIDRVPLPDGRWLAVGAYRTDLHDFTPHTQGNGACENCLEYEASVDSDGMRFHTRYLPAPEVASPPSGKEALLQIRRLIDRAITKGQPDTAIASIDAILLRAGV